MHAGLFTQKIGDPLDGRGGILFHDPVTRMRDDTLCHVGGRRSHHGCHHGPKRLFSTKGEHWHSQLANCEKRLVVNRILIEGLELLETGMHRAGTSIQGRVMLARCLVEELRVGGKLIPESVQVDSFTTLYQTFGVWTVEGEM